MYSYRDIQWVRNIKRNDGNQLAYYEQGTDDLFYIHWSKKYVDESEALKPQIGDLVLLFQNFKNEGIQFTHLVTPIDNKVKKNGTIGHPWGRKVKLLAKAPDGINRKPNGLNFKSVNQSHSYSIEKIGSNLEKEDLQKIIWNSFGNFFVKNLEYIEEEIWNQEPEDEETGQVEGNEKIELKKHKRRERNSLIIKAKKEEAKRNGTLHCECCKFDFAKIYPTLGNDFIECHHKIPIHLGERITKKEDLALVCANCHRMLHRKDENGEYKTVEEITELRKKQ